MQVRKLIDTLLSVNGQAPAPPTWFSVLLKDEFTSVPLLFLIVQQLSENFPEATISYQCIYQFVLNDILSHCELFCKQKSLHVGRADSMKVPGKQKIFLSDKEMESQE